MINVELNDTTLQISQVTSLLECNPDINNLGNPLGGVGAFDMIDIVLDERSGSYAKPYNVDSVKRLLKLSMNLTYFCC